ncbi:serine/threonine-protein phosphatase 1 regulatory subunit 10-like isoform X1 [Styela clava]
MINMKTDLRDYSKSMGSEEITDPLLLLKSLSPLLNGKGGIIGLDELSKIISAMRTCKKLVGRCIYLSILRVTKGEDILEKFICEGGWKIINKWLSDAKDTENIPVLMEILKVLQRLPVSMQNLRENNTPKIIKHFTKSSNQKLKTAASLLMSSWMAIVRGSSGPATSELPETNKKKEKKKKLKQVEQSKAKPKGESANKTGAPPPVMKAPSFAKFRKTGLETDQPIPKKKSKTTKPATPAMGKRNSVDNDSGIPEKKLKSATEIKAKKITISEGFMDALNSASNPVPIPTKKIKRRPLKPTASSNSNASNSNKMQSMEYSTGDADDFSATELLRKLSPKRVESPVPTEPAKPKLNKYGKPMKTVRFKPDEQLEMIQYFEVDENERVNVTKIPYHEFMSRIQVDSPFDHVNVSTQSFKDAQHREMMIERQLMKGGKVPLTHEGGSKNGDWRKPLPLEGLELLAVAGCNSVEKDIQTEREKTVLMEIFLTKDMVPDSPAEPDPEPYEIAQPKIIPFEDENSIVEAMEPETEPATNATDPTDIVKNMLSGIQPQGGGTDLTEKLKQILQTASAIKSPGEEKNSSSGSTQQPVAQQPMQPAMMWNGVPPQGNPQMQPMDMNGQPIQGQMGFYNAPMMVPVPYGPGGWNGPPPPNPHGMPPQHMGPPQFNNNNYNPRWNRPPPPSSGSSRWRNENPRGRRGDWRGRYDDRRRR